MLWKDTNRITCDAYRPAPVIDSRDRVIVGDDEGMLYCFTPEGALSWSTSVGDFYPGGISIGFDDRIYLQSYMDGRLYCYDSDGSQEWVQTFPWSDGALSNVCVASDGTILAYSSDMENLYCYNNDGDLCWQFSIWDSLYPGGARRNGRDEGDEYWSPAIGPDGNIYLAGDDCLFGVAWGDHRLASTAWPTYNHDNARSGWAGRQP
jgi:outer membrane protein assembly factor BamB